MPSLQSAATDRRHHCPHRQSAPDHTIRAVAASTKPASHLGASKPSTSGTNTKSPDRDQSDDKKKGHRGKGGDKKKDSGKSSGSTDKPWASTKCQICGKIGHDALHCFKYKKCEAKPSSDECTRCGRTGHDATECFRDKHKSGKALKPNGVPVPDWFAEKYMKDDSKDKDKKPEPAAGSHLNAAGGASAATRPRTLTTQW